MIGFQPKSNPPAPNPDKPELKIEDCKLNICGYRFALLFLKSKEYLKYSIGNIQSLQDSENIPNHFFFTKSKEITIKNLTASFYLTVFCTHCIYYQTRHKLVRFAHNLSRASLREPQSLTTRSCDWNDGTMEWWNIGTIRIPSGWKIIGKIAFILRKDYAVPRY